MATVSLDGPAEFFAGEEIEIDVSLDGKELVSVTGEINYNAEGFEIIDVSCNLARWSLESNAQDGKLYFAAANVSAKEAINKKTELFTVTFKANKDSDRVTGDISAVNLKASAGNGTVSVSDARYTVKSKTEIPKADNSGKTENGNTVAENGPSNNNRLASLTVKGVKLSPEFDPEEKKYEATVPFETEKLEVEAVPADEKATVTISDTELKYIGKNITRVQVVSESGLKRTYKIYTTRSAQIKKPTNSSDDSAGFTLWIILIMVFAVLVIAAAIVFLILRKKKRS